MRIFFIHGFGENENIFEKIAPTIGGNQIFINVWNEVGNIPQPELNVLAFAKKLSQNYTITENDVVIGHSMGGRIGLHIKHFSNCKLIQIASWTNPDRVISPIKNRETLYWLTKYGIYLNRFTKWLAVRKGFKNKPSRQIFEQTIDALIAGNKHCVVNQLRLIFEPVEAINIEPELRIHAKADNIIRKPKTDFYEVPGDHFTLVTYPETVVKPILEFLAIS